VVTILIVLAAWLIASSSTWAQQREARLALVIGNALYPDASVPLTSTKDARAVAEELRRDGFQVDLKENLGKADMRAALAAFTGKIAPGTTALLYFSGYGLQANRQTYLLPVNAQIWNEPDIARDGTRLDEVLAEMHRKGAGIKIAIVDAARRNPYERRVRPAPMGLSAISIPDNTLIMYSAAPDKLISESNASSSLFTNELIKELRVPNASAEEVFNRVRHGVSQVSRTEQIPWVSSSLVAAFSFSSSATPAPQPPPVVPPEHRPPPPPPVVPPEHRPPPPPPPPAVAEQPLSLERERALKPQDKFKECAGCPEMVVIEAGEFEMGSPDSEAERYPEEGPRHRVKIGRPFAVGKLMVSRDEFEAFVRDTGYSSDRCWTLEDGRVEERLGRSFRNPGFTQNGNHPAVCVSWDDARAYAAWLTRKTGKVYRLLSESEWEYAARAGSTSPFWWGDMISTDKANYNGSAAESVNSVYMDGRKGENREATVPVESFAANPFGLYQVHGNAFEWVEDCWNNNYRNAAWDDAASVMGNCSRHVRRGGAWNYIARTLRSAYRDSRPAFGRYSNTGLRIARTLNQSNR
jgi:formylglycine-generating enzyme required for sulfatase activity